MRKLALMLVTVFVSASIFASEQIGTDTQFQAGTDNPVSQLCIAALESKDALRAKAEELNMTRKEVRRVKCNGMRINEFARTYSDVIDQQAIVNVQ